MSRIPRVASSPDRHAVPSAPALKRKAVDDENPIPAKMPTLAAGARVLQPLIGIHNYGISTAGTKLPPPLVKPRAPALSASTTSSSGLKSKRSTSAPPSKTPRTIVAGVTKTMASGKAGRILVASGGTRLGTVEDERFTEIQNQMSKMEYARAVDIAKGA